MSESSLPRPQPCLTRRNGVVCDGTLLPVTDREWHCTEGHTMWGTARAMRSEPWPADRRSQRTQPYEGRFVDVDGHKEWVPTGYALEDAFSALWRWIRKLVRR